MTNYNAITILHLSNSEWIKYAIPLRNII